MSKNFIYILGVPNFANYEASVSLIRVPQKGGEIEYVCIGEDRLTRLKHTYMFPLRGIHYCLQTFGLESLEEVDYIFTDYARLPRWLNSGPAYRKLEHDYLKINLNYPRERIRVIDHHNAHAASAFYPSGFDEAAVLVVDALGSRLNTQSLYYFNGSQAEILERGDNWGIGRLYSLVTGSVLPYGPEKGFGKTMGLAPYGRFQPGPVLEFDVHDEGMTSDYSGCFTRSPIPRVVGEGFKQCDDRERVQEPYFARAAYDVQQECERQFIRMAEYAYEKTGSKNICVAGGVALNGLSNWRILEQTAFEQIWITPGCSDTGISFGLALWGYFNEIAPAEKQKVSVSMQTAYTGRSYPKTEMEDLLRSHQIEYRETTPEEIASLVAAGKVVAWFEGGSEFGPRALGHRSIVADPRDQNMKDKLNASVKFREGYRPYAPSVLAEHAYDWLDMNCPSPFMLLVVEVKEDKRALIPAVTHIDHTTRPQTVTASANPNYYRMIKAFYDLTGVAMVVNTSFNVNREPIVETPLDALICAFGTSIGYLYLEGLLVECQRYAGPELVKTLTDERQKALDDEWEKVTRNYLVNYNTEERDRYLAEENRIADWYRDYRSKYELEKPMLQWRESGARLLIVGTRAHTRCLYLYIPEFPQLDVRGFVALDDLPSEHAEFSVYPEFKLDNVHWDEIDAVLVSTHEYQDMALEHLRRSAPANKQIVTIYDDAGDSLIYVLPDRWPVMNPVEAERHGLVKTRSQADTSRGIDPDFQPSPITLKDRYAVIINYHYCQPANNGGFKGIKGIRPEDLDQQLRILKRNFSFATVGQLLDPQSDLPETVAVLTFDDGLKDVVKHALPVLERWEAPATVFCCSAPLTEGRLLDVHKIHLLQGELGLSAFQREFELVLASHKESYELESPESLGIRNLYRYDDEATRSFKMLLNYQLPYSLLSALLTELLEKVFGAESDVAQRLYLSPEEIRDCQKAGLEIGVHSHQHYILSRLSRAEQREELATAASYFKGNFGVERLHLAYPYGGSGTWNRSTMELLEELGFASGLTMDRQIVKPRDLRGKWEIPRFDTRDLFDADNSLHADKLHALFSSE
ncbi:MAG: carbamoyltransferase C-terminal domain-containing protein [Pyrinomonadaceae bacterium]